METITRFKKKYLKYKSKYLNIKKLIGGSSLTPLLPMTQPVIGLSPPPLLSPSAHPITQPGITMIPSGLGHPPPLPPPPLSPFPMTQPVIGLSPPPGPPISPSFMTRPVIGLSPPPGPPLPPPPPPIIPAEVKLHAHVTDALTPLTYVYQDHIDAADFSDKRSDPEASPFEEKVIRILNLKGKSSLFLLKEICEEVINKINRSPNNQILTFIADVNHDMETSGRKAKIIDGIIKDKNGTLYSSKLLWDLTIAPPRFNAHISHVNFIKGHKVRERDSLYKEIKKVSQHNRSHSEVLESDDPKLPVKATPIRKLEEEKNNFYKNTNSKQLPIEDFEVIPKHLSDPVLDFEGKKNSSFSLSSIITQNIARAKTNYHFECSVLKNSDENFHNRNNIGIIDQGSDDRFLTAKNFNSIDGSDFILDGLKPLGYESINKLKTNNYVNNLLERKIITVNDMGNLLVHIADQYFKNIFTILNLYRTLNLLFTKIVVLKSQWYLYFNLNDIRYIINITNRGITTHTYALNTLIIGIIEDDNIGIIEDDNIKWNLLKNIVGADNYLNNELLLKFCNIVCLTAKAFGDASYKIFIYSIAIFAKIKNESVDLTPRIVTQDRQLLADLLKNILIKIQTNGQELLIYPNIYYKIKSNVKKNSVLIATNSGFTTNNDDLNYIKISLKEYIPKEREYDVFQREEEITAIHQQLEELDQKREKEKEQQLLKKLKELTDEKQEYSSNLIKYVLLLILKICFINHKIVLKYLNKLLPTYHNYISKPLCVLFNELLYFDFDNSFIEEQFLNIIVHDRGGILAKPLLDFYLIFQPASNPDTILNNMKKNILNLYKRFLNKDFVYNINDFVSLGDVIPFENFKYNKYAETQDGTIRQELKSLLYFITDKGWFNNNMDLFNSLLTKYKKDEKTYFNRKRYFEIYCNSVIDYIDKLKQYNDSGTVEDITNMLDYLLEEIFYETNIKALCGSDNEFNVRGWFDSLKDSNLSLWRAFIINIIFLGSGEKFEYQYQKIHDNLKNIIETLIKTNTLEIKIISIKDMKSYEDESEFIEDFKEDFIAPTKDYLYAYNTNRTRVLYENERKIIDNILENISLKTLDKGLIREYSYPNKYLRNLDESRQARDDFCNEFFNNKKLLLVEGYEDNIHNILFKSYWELYKNNNYLEYDKDYLGYKINFIKDNYIRKKLQNFYSKKKDSNVLTNSNNLSSNDIFRILYNCIGLFSPNLKSGYLAQMLFCKNLSKLYKNLFK